MYCYYNGAGPEDIEQLVTRPLESAIMSVPGVDSVTSSSADSISTIQIMYVENTDVDIAATKLREKFDALSLPDGCGSPVILNINVSEMMPSAIVGLLGDDLAALQQQAENVVAPALERIDGVASVSVSGGVERQITVTLDAQRAGLRPLHQLHHADPAGGEPALSRRRGLQRQPEALRHHRRAALHGR